MAEALVQKAVKKILGLDQCKYAFTGAAPISVETLEYFASVGININEVLCVVMGCVDRVYRYSV